jgi:Tfp pilus assembly protein PilV
MFGVALGELLIIVLVLFVILAGVTFLIRALLKSQDSSYKQSERLKEL